MTRKIAISAMNWHSLSAAEKMALAAIGVSWENSLVTKQPLPIRVIESALGFNIHNHPWQYKDIVLTPAKDKEDAENKLHLLEEINGRFTARIDELFGSFLNSCMAIDHMFAPVLLIANTTHSYVLAGMRNGSQGFVEHFGTKDLSAQHTEKPDKSFSWAMENMGHSSKTIYRHTQNSAMAERLMHFADIADAIASHPS